MGKIYEADFGAHRQELAQKKLSKMRGILSRFVDAHKNFEEVTSHPDEDLTTIGQGATLHTIRPSDREPIQQTEIKPN